MLPISKAVAVHADRVRGQGFAAREGRLSDIGKEVLA